MTRALSLALSGVTFLAFMLITQSVIAGLVQCPAAQSCPRSYP